MLPSSGHKSISRINSAKNNTFGWYVRVVFGGQMHSKFFSDAKYGSEERALAQAIRHRNRIEREMGKPRTDRSVVAAKPGTGTGVVGVQRITKGGHEAFQVTWSPAPNVVSRTSVSIAKYGEDEAFRRAVKLREKKERALYGKAVMPVTRQEESKQKASSSRTETSSPVAPASQGTSSTRSRKTTSSQTTGNQTATPSPKPSSKTAKTRKK